MEFVASLNGDCYRFFILNHDSALVSSEKAEYILYRSKGWRCADELKPAIVEALGEIIDEHLEVINN